MIRLIFWIVASLIVSALVVWLAAVPGTITIAFAGYTVQPRIGTAVFLFLGVSAVVILLWSILRRVLNAPRVLARYAREQRREQGMEALSDGFIALQAGDPAKARLLARDARARLPQNAAAALLEARADLALGDMPAAREHYRALISNRKTALAALAGLYDQARQQGRAEAALTFAQKAATIDPSSSWATAAVLDDLTRRGAWADALKLLADEPAPTREDKAIKRRKQAVIETAIAREREPTDPNSALDHALTALKLLPDFVPAALIAARIHTNRNEARKAMSLLRRVWRATAHPDVATLYASAQHGAPAADRLKRLRELIDTPPANRAAAIVLARGAIDAYEWPLARNALAGYSSGDATQAVCLLMAEIEEGQNADQGKSREWLSRAIRAPRDPVWTADGVTAEEWEPVSPVSGRLDAFEWRVPVTASTTRAALPPAVIGDTAEGPMSVSQPPPLSEP